MQFPDHIVVKIAEHLQLKEILQLKLVNKQYNIALQNNVLWRQVYINIRKEVDQNSDEILDFYSIIKQLYRDTDWKNHLEIILERFDDSPLISKMYQQVPDSNLPFHMERFNRFIQVLDQFKQTSMSVHKRLFGGTAMKQYQKGYKFYDKVFTFQPLLLKPYPQDPRFLELSQIYYRKDIPVTKLLIDYQNILGFGKETIFNFTEIVLLHFIKTLQNISIVIQSSFMFKICQLSHSQTKELLVKRSVRRMQVYYIQTLWTLFKILIVIQPLGVLELEPLRSYYVIIQQTRYVPFADRDQGNMFMYQIRISDGGVEGEFQLTSRRWVIQQGTQVLPTIQGPGVIGEYPKIYPGCPDFVYESCSPTNQWHGSMSGGFSFQNLTTGEIFEAQVQSFPLALKKEEIVISLKNNNKVDIIASY